jgi:hypothetical protein
MSATKTPSQKRSTRRRVNTSQPSEILKQKQKNRLRAVLAEQRRAEEMRRQFEAFLASQTLPNNNNNNWYFSSNKQRKTRKLRR